MVDAFRTTFAVELKDETSGPAKSAASTLATLNLKIKEGSKALTEMRRAQRNLRGGTSSSTAAISELKDKISAQKAVVASAQAQYVELGGKFGKTGAAAETVSGKVGQLSAAVSQSGGALGAFSSKAAKLGSLLTNPITLIVALAAAMAALGAAVAAVTAKLLKFGLAQAGLRRMEELQLAGIISLRRRYRRFGTTVQEVRDAINGATASSDVGRATLQKYALQLARTGLKGRALEAATEAAGIAMQVQGERGVARFRALAMQTRLAGGSVAALAASYKAKLGPIAARMMLDLSSQTNRLKSDLGRLFKGLAIEDFLGSIKKVFFFFSQTTVSGRALRELIMDIFQPMLDQSGKLITLVKPFFEGMLIAALELELAVLKLANRFKGTFGNSEFLKNLDAVKIATIAGKAAFVVLAVSIAALAVPLAAVAAWIALVATGTISFVKGIRNAVNAVRDFIGEISGADFSVLGKSMIDGLIKGLKDGVAKVSQAIRRVADTAMKTFRSALKISSPSKVFMDFGANISEGVSSGVDSGKANVDASVGSLVDAPTGAGIQGNAVTISIGDINVSGAKADSPRELALALRDELASILEGVSIEMGAT